MPVASSGSALPGKKHNYDDHFRTPSGHHHSIAGMANPGSLHQDSTRSLYIRETTYNKYFERHTWIRADPGETEHGTAYLPSNE
jgi:hypothetical protein